MRSSCLYLLTVFLAMTGACSSQESRGIADHRTDFKTFLPMKANPERDGLKSVKPFFRKASRSEIMAAIEHACIGGRGGSSVYDERTGAGYYVNCNPANRQLLNGYVPLNGKQEPHSR